MDTITNFDNIKSISIDVALFDVCGTLVNTDTIFSYLAFLLRTRYRKNILKRSRYIYIRGMLKLRLYSGDRGKAALIRLTSGLKEEELDIIAKAFLENVLSAKWKTPVLDILRKLKERNTRVLLVSGGLDLYLKYLAAYLDVELIATEIEIRNGRVTGKIIGAHCSGVNKVHKLLPNKIFGNADYDRIMIFSDSVSDLPLFNLGKYKVAVDPDPLLFNIWESSDNFLIRTV